MGPHKEPPLQNQSSLLRQSWKDITVGFIMKTKVHGLKFVFSPDKTKAQRAIWVLAFLVCVSLLCTWSWNRIFYLMSFPVVTKINMVWAHNMSFPAVTLCNKNLFRVSAVTKHDLYHSGYWMDLLYSNHTVMERSGAILRDSHKHGLLSLLDFNNYTRPSNYRVNTTEMMARLGHQLEDMLLECKFRGETCTYKNFSTVCTGGTKASVRRGDERCVRGVLIIHLAALPPAGVLWCFVKVPLKHDSLLNLIRLKGNKPALMLPG